MEQAQPTREAREEGRKRAFFSPAFYPRYPIRAIPRKIRPHSPRTRSRTPRNRSRQTSENPLRIHQTSFGTSADYPRFPHKIGAANREPHFANRNWADGTAMRRISSLFKGVLGGPRLMRPSPNSTHGEVGLGMTGRRAVLVPASGLNRVGCSLDSGLFRQRPIH